MRWATNNGKGEMTDGANILYLFTVDDTKTFNGRSKLGDQQEEPSNNFHKGKVLAGAKADYPADGLHSRNLNVAAEKVCLWL